MSRKRKEDIIEEFLCHACNKYHEFKRVGERSKLTNKAKMYTNKWYGWSSIDCPAGGAYMEEHMPGEHLTISKTGKRRGYKSNDYEEGVYEF